MQHYFPVYVQVPLNYGPLMTQHVTGDPKKRTLTLPSSRMCEACGIHAL